MEGGQDPQDPAGGWRRCRYLGFRQRPGPLMPLFAMTPAVSCNPAHGNPLQLFRKLDAYSEKGLSVEHDY